VEKEIIKFLERAAELRGENHLELASRPVEIL